MTTLPAVLPATLAETGTVSGGETLLFWVLAPIMVLAALGLVFAHKAVYAALCAVVVMISLAFLYVAQGAPFLGVAQVVVYTGAIMMLFLFVLMLVGVDASDSLHETIKGQRWVAALAGLGLALVLVGVVVTTTMPAPVGIEAANADSNPVGVARLIFSDHVLTMELTGALLITAALGAVTLTHRDRLTARLSQRDVADAKMRAFAERGASIAQQPAPGVYARSNAASVPALSAAGQPIEDSVPRVLRIRGQQVSIGEVAPQVVEAVARRRGATPAADVPQSGLPGMPGEPPPALPAARQAPALTENAEDGNR